METPRQPIWAEQWPCPPDLARVLIEENWPDLAPVRLEALDAGWDNTVYRVNGTFVFRFPRREIARPLLETELTVLPWLAPRLKDRIPVPRFRGKPARGYPSVFAGYGFLEGRTLNSAGWTDDLKARLARPLARFLSELHAVGAEEARKHGAPIGDPLRKLDFAGYRERVAEAMGPLLRSGRIDRSFARRLDEVLASLPRFDRPSTRTLVHGDFHGNQILVDQEDFAGVIDWGDVHCGDPALDLAGVHAVLPASAHDEFLNTYGPVDPPRWEAARGRAIILEFWGLAHAVDVGNDSTARECFESLRRLLGMR